MRRSIATVSLSGTLEEKLEAAAVARFDAVEIFENDLLFFDGTPRDVRRMAADLGLEIALYQPFRDFEGVTEDQLRRNLDRAERKFDVMQELSAPLVLVCSNVSPATIDDDARAADQLAMLADRAARRGLRVGYEALAWGARVTATPIRGGWSNAPAIRISASSSTRSISWRAATTPRRSATSPATASSSSRSPTRR